MTGQGASDLAEIAEASGDVVSPEQTLILFALVARHGFAPQKTSASRSTRVTARRC